MNWLLSKEFLVSPGPRVNYFVCHGFSLQSNWLSYWVRAKQFRDVDIEPESGMCLKLLNVTFLLHWLHTYYANELFIKPVFISQWGPIPPGAGPGVSRAQDDVVSVLVAASAAELPGVVQGPAQPRPQEADTEAEAARPPPAPGALPHPLWRQGRGQSQKTENKMRAEGTKRSQTPVWQRKSDQSAIKKKKEEEKNILLQGTSSLAQTFCSDTLSPSRIFIFIISQIDSFFGK